MRNYRLSLKAELDSRAGAHELLKAPGDAVLIQRGMPRWLLLRCPCGCGEDIPINLDYRAGKAWRLYRGPTSGVTLFPSIWRDTGCRSHFVIWRDWIFMFGLGGPRVTSRSDSFDVATLSRRVLDVCPYSPLTSYVEIADALGEIPWDVEEACRYLVRLGKLVEGSGDQRGYFRRTRK